MPPLSDVLTANDLPAAELCAARLDGELVTIDDAYACVDVSGQSGPARARCG